MGMRGAAPPPPPPSRPRDAEASKKELNALADLIQVNSSANDDFKLNLDSLFGNIELDMGGDDGITPDVATVRVGVNQNYSSIQKLLKLN